jgi:5-methyltetrahydropteroyltriglutamate--homocysteine methyltransferase
VKRSLDRILTTHVGSLARPNDLVELYRNDAPESQLFPRLRSAIADVVRAQSSSGIDIVNDGEFGKAMRRSVDFGAWWSYVYDRLAGFDLREEAAKKGRAAWTFGSKERKEFAEFYAEEASAGQGGAVAAQGAQAATSSARMYGLTCTAPVKYTGQAIVQHDIENLKAALAGVGAEEAFMTAVSPATLQILPNEYYKSRRNIPGRWPRPSTRNTKPSSMPASSCKSTIPPWSTSGTGGTRSTATWPAIASGPPFRSRR